MSAPRILIAGMSGGGGKTLVSVGILGAWRAQGRAVAAFKKGPDYIDAAWLTRAAGRPCRNLDLFLMPTEAILTSVATASADVDIAVIEGNRGLFDGMDAQGSCSTAELAKLLHTPVVLVIDCTKSTRTVAALVLGCQRLDPELTVGGVILNRVAGSRHETVVRQAIAQACQVPVVGAIPRLDRHPFPERHLGLVPPQEHGALDDAVAEAASIVRQHVDLAALWRVGARSPALPATTGAVGNAVTPTARIGVFRDAAFQFYYEENLEALAHAGGRVIEISPLEDVSLPDVDALYIGGGFPETLAGALADNQPFRTSVREAVARGLPVYAECGGTVYLGKQLVMDDHVYPMAGAFGATFGFGTRPQGHGYVQLTAVRANPFYPIGTALAGHEFHYTFLESLSSEASTFACRVERGHGFDGHSDGLCHRNVLALYTHVHALGTTSWAPGLVHAALRHQSEAPAAGLRD